MGFGQSKPISDRESFTTDARPPSYNTSNRAHPGFSLYNSTSHPSGGLTHTTTTPGVYTSTMAPTRSQEYDSPVANIVLFGSVGSGKSAVINMLAGQEVARTSNGAVGCGGGIEPYEFIFNEPSSASASRRERERGLRGKRFVFWDTPGLDEPEKGSVPNGVALEMLYELLVGRLGTLGAQNAGHPGQPEMTQEGHATGLAWTSSTNHGNAWPTTNPDPNSDPHPYPSPAPSGGVNLLIFCVERGRVTESVLRNFKIVHEMFCCKQVPVLLVVTGLEEEDVARDWWVRPENRNAYTGNGIVPNGVVCVSATRGKRRLGSTVGKGFFGVYENEWEASRKELEREVLKTYLPKGWEASPVQWMAEPSAPANESGGLSIREWAVWAWSGLKMVNGVIGAGKYDEDDVGEGDRLVKQREKEAEEEREREEREKKTVVDGAVKGKLVEVGLSDGAAEELARQLAMVAMALTNAQAGPPASREGFY